MMTSSSLYRLYATFMMYGCVCDELQAMKEGLNDIIPPELLAGLTAEVVIIHVHIGRVYTWSSEYIIECMGFVLHEVAFRPSEESCIRLFMSKRQIKVEDNFLLDSNTAILLRDSLWGRQIRSYFWRDLSVHPEEVGHASYSPSYNANETLFADSAVSLH